MQYDEGGRPDCRSMTGPGERVGLVVEGRFPFDPIDIRRPGTQIDQAAALRTERTMRTLRPPNDTGATGRAFDLARLGGFVHRLQKEISKTIIRHCFIYRKYHKNTGNYAASYTR